MSDPERRTLPLVEFVPAYLDAGEFSKEAAEALLSMKPTVVDIGFPTSRTNQQWVLISQGWVGFLPVGADLLLALGPKVSIENLFGMWDVAYGLEAKAPWTLEGEAECTTVAQVFEWLAQLLATRVLARGRRGFHRSYVGREETLSFIRGRVDHRRMVARPWEALVNCKFEEHTGDIDDNRLLAWTLSQILRAGFCTDRVLSTVRRAYHEIAGISDPVPFTAADCAKRQYNRLNQDYGALHGLCRFFLEGTGPTAEGGDHRVMPFLINMATLFELFVAKWLGGWLERSRCGCFLDVKLRRTCDPLQFEVDLVLSDASTRRAVGVLDTKYKRDEKPANDDVCQVVTYAELLGCREAVLIYPSATTSAIDVRIGGIRVRSVSFDLDAPIERAGEAFLGQLGVTRLLQTNLSA